MPQDDNNFTQFGTFGTATGTFVIKSGPVTVHTINVTSSGTAGDKFFFYNATTSSTGANSLLAAIPVDVKGVYTFDTTLNAGLTRGISTSTAEVTVTWG